MKLKTNIIILAVAAMGRALAGYTLAGNTYDAAIETHDFSVRRTNDAAIAQRHLLWKKGAGDGTVALNTDGDIPLGTIDNTETGTGAGQTVLLLGKGPTKKMVAAGAIGVGAQCYTADDGEVQALPAAAGTYYCVGTALTAAANDQDIIEVQDCVPFAVVVAG